MKTRLLAGATCAALGLSAASAQTSSAAGAQSAARAESFPEVITVIGLTGDPADLPGSAALLTDADLAVQAYSDITRIVRAVPGVNVQEEDGYGLRPNIGLRGAGLDRSAKITLMEDGVLIAPAPYAAPSAYYFPHAGRMAGVEIVKGAAGVRYGPQTQGGSVNLLSTPVPDELAGHVDVRAGEEGRRRAHLWVGGMGEPGDAGVRVGGLFEGFYDAADGFKAIDNYPERDTGFSINDFVGKLRLETRAFGADHAFELKGQISDEVSDETYLGLTEADFAADPFRRYAGSAFDVMNADHEEISLRYAGVFDNGVEVTGVVYRTDFARDWFKSDKVDLDGRGPGGTVSISSIVDDPATYAGELRVLRAPAGFVSARDALLVKHNNRVYYAQGVQGEIAGDAQAFGADIAWRAGARLHSDEMDRFQWYERFQADDGRIVKTSEDVPGTESNRIDSADAAAVFVQADMSWGDFTLIPGVRFESVELKRENFGGGDPERTGANLRVTENEVDWAAPGLGFRYEASPAVTVFGGVHRGYSPPTPGSADADAEEAVNYELGARWADAVSSFEAVAFFNDYDNILGVCTASTGGGCTIGDQFDGGAAEIRGLELVAETDAVALAGAGWGVAIPLRAAYTFTEGEFETGFASDYDPWGTVEAGDALPDIPEHQLYLSAGIETDRLGAEIAANWTDDVRTEAGSGAIPSDALIEARWVADAAAWWALTDRIEARVNVRNLFDETYVAARRPAGLRPGAPRAVTLGISADF